MAARIVNHLKRADLGDLRLFPVPPPHMLGMLLVGHGDDVCIVAIDYLFCVLVAYRPMRTTSATDVAKQWGAKSLGIIWVGADGGSQFTLIDVQKSHSLYNRTGSFT